MDSSSLLTFPFGLAAAGLKSLSETGSLGNGLALALWVGLSLCPLWFVFGCRKRPGLGETLSLCFLSAVLLLGLYGLANPLWVSSQGGEEGAAAVQAVFGVSIWSAVIWWIAQRLIRLLRSGDAAALFSLIRALLLLLCLWFTAVCLLTLAGGVQAAAEAFRSAGAEIPPDAAASSGALDALWELLRAAAAALPYGLNLGGMGLSLRLLPAVKARDAERIAAAGRALRRFSLTALGISAAVPALWNGLQLLALGRLTHVSAAAQLPLLSLAFTCILLLLSRLLEENQRLQDDNSLFI